MKKKNTPIQATHIAFLNCNQFVFLEKKKKKRKHLEARDLFGLGKSVCFVWVYT